MDKQEVELSELMKRLSAVWYETETPGQLESRIVNLIFACGHDIARLVQDKMEYVESVMAESAKERRRIEAILDAAKVDPNLSIEGRVEALWKRSATKEEIE